MKTNASLKKNSQNIKRLWAIEDDFGIDVYFKDPDLYEDEMPVILIYGDRKVYWFKSFLPKGGKKIRLELDSGKIFDNFTFKRLIKEKNDDL